jgi:hypothetical protein
MPFKGRSPRSISPERAQTTAYCFTSGNKVPGRRVSVSPPLNPVLKDAGSSSISQFHKGCTCVSTFTPLFYPCSHDCNSQFAKIGGIPLGEMNELEIDLLIRLDHRLNVQVPELELFLAQLEQVNPVEVEEVVEKLGRTEKAFREFEKITARRCQPLGLRLSRATFIPTC